MVPPALLGSVFKLCFSLCLTDLLFTLPPSCAYPSSWPPIFCVFSSYRTPLHTAAGKGMVAMARFFIRRGANVDALDQDDRTPVSLACPRWELTAETEHENFRFASR